MNETDLILLVVYFILVASVLRQAIESLEKKIAIRFEGLEFPSEAEAKIWEDLLSIDFKLKGRYSFDQPRTLTMGIKNKSEKTHIYVDWDHSALTDLGGGRSRRIIRLAKGDKLDLSQAQVSSFVAPQSSLQVEFTAEDVMRRSEDRETVESNGPLFQIPAYSRDFMSGKTKLPFSLWLKLSRFDPALASPYEDSYVRCKFVIERVPWVLVLSENLPQR